VTTIHQGISCDDCGLRRHARQQPAANIQTNLAVLWRPVTSNQAFPTDILLTYLLHPGTACISATTAGLSNLALDNLGHPVGRFTKGAGNRNSQLVFVKVSYFRFKFTVLNSA